MKKELFGVQGLLLIWLIIYLQNQCQCVSADRIKSSLKENSSVVPRGSILRPLLFFIFLWTSTVCVTSPNDFYLAMRKNWFEKIRVRWVLDWIIMSWYDRFLVEEEQIGSQFRKKSKFFISRTVEVCSSRSMDKVCHVNLVKIWGEIMILWLTASEIWYNRGKMLAKARQNSVTGNDSSND